ncbi:hypothetical protein AG1IA_07008 [Rhizoctonia solani AG-1 IA]|uniref:Uncharacterized protein n=1 Tax=Thanatephorus cucumeris (strain AG1-IA) TaxID=983506 RepID=L8WQB0_THACA|nr:hypothetical protein AG1IA_07008 [Rhizoctonia solani AG-1 IA]
MPDLLFINDLPYLVVVSLFMVERSGEHRLLARREVDGYDQVRFRRRTPVPRGARFYMIFHNDLSTLIRVQAFRNRNKVRDEEVESTGTMRLSGFFV